MELIVLINLAFSVVGFFFIVRMWKEVKERRDYYGEHFAIPTGQGVYDQVNLQQQAPMMQQQPEQMSMEQLAAAVVAAMGQQNQTNQNSAAPDGDLQRLIANAAAQNGGNV